MVGRKLELSFSNPALERNKMQRVCSTVVIHPSPIILEGEKPAHKSVVLRASKPTDAQKGGLLEIGVGWLTVSENRNRTTGHSSSSVV